MVFGAAAPTSSMLLVDNVLKMKMQPAAPVAVRNIKINHGYYVYTKLFNFTRLANVFLPLIKWYSMKSSDGKTSQ
jgi:hypothetical protein